MDAPTKTHECAENRWLECPSCQGKGNSVARQRDCPTCTGTGLRFPGLSKECCSSSERHRLPLCPYCQGRGRVPVDTLEVWIDAAEILGLWEMSKEYNGYYFHILLPEEFYSIEQVPTRLAAVQQALCRALGIHPAEVSDVP